MPVKQKPIKELEWEGEKRCFYQCGYIDPWSFIVHLREQIDNTSLDPEDAEALKKEDVQYLRFRPMSPSEARNHGWDHGVMVAKAPQGYEVTCIIMR